MKKTIFALLFLEFCLLPTIVKSQNNVITIDFQNNLLLLNPKLNIYEKKYGNKIEVKNFALNLKLKVLKHKKCDYKIGFSFKKQKLVEQNRIKNYNVITSSYNSDQPLPSFEYDTIYMNFKDQADLEMLSYNLGFSNELNFYFNSLKKYSHSFGLFNEIYFIEYYKTKYVTSDYENYFSNYFKYYKLPTLNESNYTKFFLASLNLSTFYRFTYKASEKFSLATKISIGTNLYSDWDQFKKYAWLGVGLELGFGNKPLFKKKSSNFD